MEGGGFRVESKGGWWLLEGGGCSEGWWGCRVEGEGWRVEDGVGCPIFASYFFSLRSETKRNRNRFASFSLRFAKLKKNFSLRFASFSL